jgi:peptidoglycan hydrolase-like protein with peptidoglycan-binding domain
LKYYYGQDIYLAQAEKVEGVPMSYPGEALRAGSSGPNVRWVQERLNRISDNFPAIGKLRVDGFFGEETVASVKKFQEVFRLTQDGIVGFSTWYRLSHLYVAVTRMAELQ